MLEVKNMNIAFKANENYVNVTDKVSFQLKRGETLGIVGESGCGKSVTVQALMGLLTPIQSRVRAEVMTFEGHKLLELSPKEWCKIRGNEISMIFQNPMTCLNPLMSCGKQIREVIVLHQKVTKKEAKKKSIDLLGLMGISEPEKHYDFYPHQLSGGMLQRVMIAMALACEPKLLIADEPTTALDVTIQSQILKLIKDLQKNLGMAFILITHDLGVLEDMVDNILVMYAGQVVETGTISEVLKSPIHPYTKGLIQSIPKLNNVKSRLQSIEGTVPIPSDFPTGCRFYDRCSNKKDSCREFKYQLEGPSSSRQSSCQFWREI